MKMSDGVLNIFPTELAKRQAERTAVLKTGVIDTCRLSTQKKLLGACERAARCAGLLTGRVPDAAQYRILLEQAVTGISFSPRQPIAQLSPSSRAKLLKQLIDRCAFLAENRDALVQWLLAHKPDHKLHGFGQLLEAWQTACKQSEVADRFAVNTALLKLIGSGDLPSGLNHEIHFRSVRWFNPFEERFVAALKTRLGPEKVRIFSVLPGEHAQAASDRLCATVRVELGSEEEWKPWLEDFADAYETDDSNLLAADSSERVSFFISAHPYGEIEDAARRIAAEIKQGTVPDRMALIVRDVGLYTDIVPDVFQRFGIPCYFRRGTPAAAYPPVKALLTLLSFPQTRSRDRLCDLLLSPAVSWPGVEDPEKLVAQIRKTQPPRLQRLPKELRSFFPDLPFSEQVNSFIEQHSLDLPEEVLDLVEEIHQTTEGLFDSERMISLFEELLDNVTLKDELSTESGVWIVNPMDAAGLRFESIFIVGMDDRSFPKIPQADSLLSGVERKALRAFLEERGIPCPRLALSETGEALIQEEILFLTALSCATEKLFLSYTRADADGKERAPGEFFERMRRLANIDKPDHGESFHTILPPEAVRAEDEVRQTAAFQGRTGLQPVYPGKDGLAGCLSYIQQWMKKNPEFSATALESLARNRFVFFLEKVLGIKPDRTHEDDTDPMDRGSLVHDILEQIYTAIAEQSDLYATQSRTSVPLALNDRDGRSTFSWRITRQKAEDSLPLAVFEPSKEKEIISLAHEIAEAEFAKAERRPGKHLGHPAVWETEKRKLHQVIENFIRMDLETALSETRYPALFELKFDEKHDLPVALTHPNCRAGMVEDLPATAGRPLAVPALQLQEIRLKGKIDRIDLIFDGDGHLSDLLVVDYKGKSKTDNAETIAKKTALNLDCQLALYTFAAQQFFFGEHNTPELNERVQAVYHLQERDLTKMTKHFSNDKKRLVMTPELTEQFLETLFSNVWKFSQGDLAAEPLIAGYEDYSHICRTTAIDPNELLKESKKAPPRAEGLFESPGRPFSR